MQPGQRSHERSNLNEIVEYFQHPDTSSQYLTGMLSNFSYSGLCIITHHPLQAGQEIIIKRFLMSYSITAIVRWCNDMGNNTYAVGLEFKNEKVGSA